MKFNTSTNELQKALSKIIGVVPSKSTLPALENVLFELSANTLKITTTDLEISMIATIQVSGNQDGKIAVPAKKLMETIRTLPDIEIDFSSDPSNKVVMKTDSGQYRMSGESNEEFPAVAEFKGKRDLEIDNNLLKRFISKTVFAVSKDELRPSMMGVLFQIKSNEFRAVATDGHRLVRIINQDLKSHGFQKDLIIPEKALQLVLRSSDDGENRISISDTHIMFDFGNTVLVSRLIDEAYPNYESVIPLENEKKLTVNRSNLLSSVRRVSLYSNSTTHQIRFSMSGKKMEVSAEDADIGGEAKENITCDYSADEMEIGFNAKYIEDILSHIDSEEVVFKFSSPTRAGIVEPSVQKHNEDVLMLVMPVRLNG